MSYLMKILTTFAMSMVPVVELRGGIPYGLSQGLEWPLVYLIAVVGNLLPIPFILLFIRRILQWMKRYPRLARAAQRIEARAAKRSDRVRRSEIIGLCMFVAIPLPGTGAWTGALIAALMDMRLKKALPSITVGVLIAGAIVTTVIRLGIHALNFLVG